MTQSHDGSSPFEDYAATDEGARELAAVDLASQAARLIRQAIHYSPFDQRTLASTLGVTESRVSQVVNGDGNLRIAAIAKYMRALGYETQLLAHPLQEGLPELPQKPAGRPRRRIPDETLAPESLPANVIPFEPRETAFNPAYAGVGNRGGGTEPRSRWSESLPLVYER
jgi:predicted XRE-type DNA-binding protein